MKTDDLSVIQINRVIQRLEEQIQQLRSVVHDLTREDGPRHCNLCPNPAIYLGRCRTHPPSAGQRICLTCLQPDYHSHNNNCEGRDFEHWTTTGFNKALQQ